MSKRYYTEVRRYGKNVLIREIDEHGNRRMHEDIIQPYIYLPFQDDGKSKPDAVGVNKKPLARVNFSNVYEFKTFLEQYQDIDNFEMYGNKNPLVQYKAEKYKCGLEYNINHIHGAIIDIEVVSGDIKIDDTGKRTYIKNKFPKPELAEYPITFVSIYDTNKKMFIALGLETFQGVKLGTLTKQHPSIKNERVAYKGFDSEIELLTFLLRIFKEKKYDYISGWYSNGFDIPYIYNRIKRLMGEKEANKISPWEIVRVYDKTVKNGDKEKIVTVYDIYGTAMLDFKELVDKHGFVNLDDGKLNTAAEHFLKEKKLDYDEYGDLGELYINNYDLYGSYCIVDSGLVARMEKKLGFINVSYQLAYITNCNPEDTLATIEPWYNNLYSTLHSEGKEPAIKKLYKGVVEFEGGYVSVPKVGRYRYVVSDDAASLYPSLIMQFNMGVETKIETKLRNKILDELIAEISAHQDYATSAYLKKLVNHLVNRQEVSQFYWEEIYLFKTLSKYNVCMAPNLAMFSLENESIIARRCRECFTQRAAVKKEMLKLEQELVNYKESDRAYIENLEIEIAKRHNMQMALKILMNSLYGAMGNRYFTDFFDIDVATAITLGGQCGIKFISKCVDDRLRVLDNNPTKDYAFYNDTDSVYFTVDSFVDRKFTKEEQKDIHKVIDYMDELVNTQIADYLLDQANKLAESQGCKVNKLVFKREALCISGVWCAKKRYALMIVDNEGVRYDKPKLKFIGLDGKKAEFPAICRAKMKEIYEICLMEDEDAMQTAVEDFKRVFVSSPLHVIAAPRRANDIHSYFDANFNPIRKGAPYNTKAAALHNKIVQDKQLITQPILEGNKFLCIPLKRKYDNSEYFAFEGKYNTDFGIESIIDIEKAYFKYFLKPLRNFTKAIGWSDERRVDLLSMFGVSQSEPSEEYSFSEDDDDSYQDDDFYKD